MTKISKCCGVEAINDGCGNYYCSKCDSYCYIIDQPEDILDKAFGNPVKQIDDMMTEAGFKVMQKEEKGGWKEMDILVRYVKIIKEII